MTDGRHVLIIIPTYNRAHLLPDALESVFVQDYPFIKIAIVDDGSADDTRRLCAQYVERHPGIISYRYQENRGCSSARNSALCDIDDTIGYVCFLDSDDRLLPGKLTREVALLEKHPEVGFTYSDAIVFDAVLNIEEMQRVAGAENSNLFSIEHFLTNEAKPAALLYRASVVKNVRFREDLRYNEDSEFLQRIAITNRGYYSCQPGCWQRWHSGSKSRNFLEISKAVLLSNRDVIRAYPEFYLMYKPLIDQRMKQLSRSLAVEMLLARQWAGVPEYTSSWFLRAQAKLRLSIYYRLRRKMSMMVQSLRKRRES